MIDAQSSDGATLSLYTLMAASLVEKRLVHLEFRLQVQPE